ncbi:hypothetical protein PPERSA_08160 [Pseudocohnilembus persalinus]|uniref:Uncharacterized protein n=1 Tax=Pseudocohnilembus persalinus TaxID=266149 RepID=A0A0V0R3B9_PSEPJ|nr:hypothetical protein PPERSA_08160 [Pseudocohnilembus persalinus]|eukprot:KRX08957.1 hypothetical protein PPERSA_08160 [Pseudocohnilembus persalinus]
MIQNSQKNQQKQVTINPNPINSKQQYQKQQPQQINAQIDKQKFQKFYKELQHEFQSEEKNPEIEKQWKKELDLIKSSNLSKEKILEKNKHTYKKEGGIDQELQQMLREQKHINFQQNQEFGKQQKIQEKFNEILEKKRNIGQKENNGLLNTITDFQQTENQILQYNQVIKEQEKEIQKLDQQLEQKYQEKAQSQELINLLDDMENEQNMSRK